MIVFLTEDFGDHAEYGAMLLPQRVGGYAVGSQGELESSFLGAHRVVVLGTRIHPLETRTESNSSTEKKRPCWCRRRITNRRCVTQILCVARAQVAEVNPGMVCSMHDSEASRNG